MKPTRILLEGEHPCGTPREYVPHADDHDALSRACPICGAGVGAWCGGKGDVHTERVQGGDDIGDHARAELARQNALEEAAAQLKKRNAR